MHDIFINWIRSGLAYDKVPMTKAGLSLSRGNIQSLKLLKKNRLTLSPGSRVMLVPIPLVMRGVPAQIFFAVPGDKT